MVPTASVQVLFLALTGVMVAIVVLGTHRATANQSRSTHLGLTRPALLTAGMLTLWLAFTGTMAASGFLQQFDASPPRAALVIAPALMAVVALGLLSGRKGWAVRLDTLPPSWLVGAQTFRVAVELVLYLLFTQGILTALMTPEGRNFDVLAGLTAPLVALAVARGWRRLAITWHLVGLALLANVLLLGILSTPSPFRVFMQEPANTVLITFPFVWLPSFLLPLAAALHLLSLRQLLTGHSLRAGL